MVSTDGPEPEAVRRFNWTQFEEPSVAVMDAMSALLGVDPLDIPPLYQAIDPDSLERLLSPRSSARTPLRGSVQFEYHDHWVRIASDGYGLIYEQEPSFAQTDVQHANADD